MNSSPSSIQCPNPACLHPDNSLGRRLCDRCQTPLVYRYLWASGEGIEQIPAGTQVGDRYLVMFPQVWLDTQPALLPAIPTEFPAIAMPYLHLFAQRLHVPEVYGFSTFEGIDVILLDNVPLDPSGQPLPALETLWTKVSAVRQLYWLWQLLELWVPLQTQGVANSLLVPDNVRVEGWRVRLRELYPDATGGATAKPPTLAALAAVWMRWIKSANETIAPQLQAIAQQMQTVPTNEAGYRTVSTALNQLLLERAADVPLRLQVVTRSSTGTQRSHNEDACFPPEGKAIDLFSSTDPLLPHLAIVCDGIGGHAGGEVASQLAIRSLQLQIRALLAEVAEQTELIPPDVVMQQIEAIIRVVNNLIAGQNNEQGREARQRMGTTLVLALQLPQKLTTEMGARNTHELYIANVGDSRAYWITPRYCHQLTVDDDIATREVRLGRSLYHESLRRADAGALIQALGTRDAETIFPTVRRFMIEEEGVLLLCSDGLSDNGLVERSWESMTHGLFKGKMPLEIVAQTWLELANRHNGHDNISIVMLYCRVTQEEPTLFDPNAPATPSELTPISPLSEASRALLYDQDAEEDLEPVSEEPQRRSPNYLALTFGLLVLFILLGGMGLSIWRQVDPVGFGQTWERLLQPSQE
ncbi:protein phosphatase 2C domain-containing protein [Oscillatoria sp. FACHB-1407]|uniref:PP2C family protein-serine/threonine phosphatase n=1 Tax=Oscillatoria sp. FACHB-1407 TaxID=2692847 RepID=UPI0016860A97|nr:protein phosphatase 2C domain-containing protein [Oscillatoria sp. FACHB-1407]MBD2463882.1 protein phosphatase 2C domain-containing protein [Oscillatoria sp. FACHB-1407]